MITDNQWDQIAINITQLPRMNRDAKIDVVVAPANLGRSYIQFLPAAAGKLHEQNGCVLQNYLFVNNCSVFTNRPSKLIVQDKDLLRLFLPSEPIWHSGPPPFIGWWSASNTDNLWRWWDGSCWSLPIKKDATRTNVKKWAHTPTIVDNRRIHWTSYWPENARVHRVRPV